MIMFAWKGPIVTTAKGLAAMGDRSRRIKAEKAKIQSAVESTKFASLAAAVAAELDKRA